MRFAAGAAILLLAACSQEAPAPDPDNLIDCALAGADVFARDCVVETARNGDGMILTVRHPDGGFRRFTVAADGRIASADGAEGAVSSSREGGYDLAIGTDRYRLPAGPTDHDGQ